MAMNQRKDPEVRRIRLETPGEAESPQRQSIHIEHNQVRPLFGAARDRYRRVLRVDHSGAVSQPLQGVYDLLAEKSIVGYQKDIGASGACFLGGFGVTNDRV